MTIEMIVVAFLSLLLIAQQGFYMWQVHRMLNKLMSRNYTEYAQVNHVYGPKTQNGFSVPIENEDIGPDRVKELNRMMGM